MKKACYILFVFILLACGVMRAETECNPVANADAVVLVDNMRFTVLTPQLIRIEWSKDKKFEDKATFTVVNRRLPVPKFKVTEANGYMYIKTDSLELKYKRGAFAGRWLNDIQEVLSVTLTVNGKKEIWYPWKRDLRNLKGTNRTLDGAVGDNKLWDLEDGILSRSGWAFVNDSYSVTRPDGGRSLALETKADGMQWAADRSDHEGIDWYFFGYGHNYRDALRDYTRIAGRIPMPPRYVFGYWYSKYEKYTEQDFKDIANELIGNDVPIDVMVIDMDWHINGWTGWSWNRELIPNPKGLLSWLHSKNLKTTLNLHPADGVASNEDNFGNIVADLGLNPDTTKRVPWAIEDYNFYKSFFKNIIRLRESEGVDFWWLDWQQWGTCPGRTDLSETFWCNHVFYEDMRLNRPHLRPVIFHRWGGLGSHRYQIGFSGDAHSTFETLAYEPYFTATASNVGYGYWGHDLGGHFQDGDNNPELYLRWMQFGVFTPIFRTHSTNKKTIERRIWKYPNFEQLRDAVYLRYSLIPYIYTAARECYDTGVSICHPLYYDDADNAECYEHQDEYMFGNDILVAPIVEASDSDGLSRKMIWLPQGEWWGENEHKLLQGRNRYNFTYTQEQIPYFYRAGSVIPLYPRINNLSVTPDRLILRMIPGGDGETSLYEDQGDSEGYKRNEYTRTRITQRHYGKTAEYTIYPRTGAFEGMMQARAYTIEVLNADKPKKVQLNGAKCEYTYNPNDRIVKINVPLTACDSQVKVMLK